MAALPGSLPLASLGSVCRRATAARRGCQPPCDLGPRQRRWTPACVAAMPKFAGHERTLAAARAMTWTGLSLDLEGLRVEAAADDGGQPNDQRQRCEAPQVTTEHVAGPVR